VHNYLSKKPLRSVAIVGVGLLGGSIGLAIRAAGFATTRIGIGRRKEPLDKALEYDAVDEVTMDMSVGIRQADLVVVCTPIGIMPAMFEQMAPHLADDCIVTDVGSTKSAVVRMARKHLGRNARFIGSHPIAGSEKTGVEFARADLFQRTVCIVTPTTKSEPAAVQTVMEFWKALGSHVHKLSPTRHDQVLARVSHLPHAVAAALVLMAERSRSTSFAGSGFGDTTRIASGDPTLWRDIFGTNREAVLKALDVLERELHQFRRAVLNKDDEALVAWLAKAKTARDAWVKQRYAHKEVEP